MSVVCNCESGLNNTGKPGCVNVFGYVSRIVMVPLKANDGTLNFIDVSAPLTATTLTDKTKEADKSKRFFPTPSFVNVTLPKAESQTEEADTGRLIELAEGKRSYGGELWGEDATPEMLGKLKTAKCVQFGLYLIDKNGALIGSISDDGTKLYPIPVDNQSWRPVLMFATPTTTQKIMLSFDFARFFDDSSLKMITATEAQVDLLDENVFTGLIDSNLVASSITTTGFVIDATTDYGTALQASKIKGQAAADFQVYNNTTLAVVTPTSVTETADGEYTFVIPAQSSSDDITVTHLPASGYEGEVDFQIP